MKTHLKLLAVLMLLTIFSACDKEEVDDSSLLSANNSSELRKYNNGMIKSYSSETILKWNELLGASIDEKMPLPAETKIYAMVTIAMHDALNNVVPKYETYALDNTSVDASNVSKKNISAMADAAVSQAAHNVLVQLFPGATINADALLSTILSGIEDVTAKNKGVEIGQNAALAIFEKRQSDFPFVFTTWNPPSNEPGIYQANFAPWMFPNLPIWPANAVYAVNLGELTPFGIASSDQFLGGELYAINSPEYTKDYNEVKALGCANCPEKTAEQNEIADFWLENTSSSTNRIARSLIKKEELNGWEAARLIALIEMAQMDSYIASFEEKYFFKFWAPITAIRGGDADGNPDTVGDPSWTPPQTTPPVLEFPDTQAYATAAAAEIFKNYFGTNNYIFTVTSPYYLPGVERSMTSFTQISKENGLSRLYLGHHYRHSIDVGEDHGKELGNYIFENNLREYR